MSRQWTCVEGPFAEEVVSTPSSQEADARTEVDRKGRSSEIRSRVPSRISFKPNRAHSDVIACKTYYIRCMYYCKHQQSEGILLRHHRECQAEHDQ